MGHLASENRQNATRAILDFDPPTVGVRVTRSFKGSITEWLNVPPGSDKGCLRDSITRWRADSTRISLPLRTLGQVLRADAPAPLQRDTASDKSNTGDHRFWSGQSGGPHAPERGWPAATILRRRSRLCRRR